VPDSVERRTEDSMGGLGTEMRESTLGDREGIHKDIRAVEKLRRVGRDAMVVGNPLIFGDTVWADDGSIRSNAKLREDC